MAYSGAYRSVEEPEERVEPPEEETAERGPNRTPAGNGGRRPLSFDLGALLKKTEIAGMETDDLLMALVLYLMYRESGDTDLLIMLGVMLLT